MEGSPVELYVYDLSRGLAKQFSAQLVGQHFEGIWHTGIVVYGREYFYGGGLQAMNPGHTPFGVPAQRIPLGVTAIPKEIFEEFLQTMNDRFNVGNYDLFHNNCNHFTEEASVFLTGSSIPAFIRTLPTDFLSTPFGAMLKPVIDSFYGRAANPLPTAAVVPPTPAEPKQVPPHTHPMPVAAAIPRHPHLAMSLPNIGYSQLALFDKGEPTTIYEKLNSFLGGLPVEKKLTTEESQALSSFAAVIVAKDRSAPIAANSIAALDKVLSALSPEQYFPVLDMVRFGVLWSSFNTAATTPADSIISRLLKNHLNTHTQTPPPRSLVLIGLRLLSNLFAHPAGAHYLVAPAVVPLLVDAIVLGLNSPDASVRLSAATLAYNTSLYLVCNESEALAQLLSAIIALLNDPSLKADDETAYLLLVSVGHFLYCNNAAVDLAKVLELDTSRFNVGKPHAVAQEVQRMLT